MIRKSKLYARPMKLYEKSRIQEEDDLMKTYGLKNKREIWKTLSKVNYFRRRAMALAQLTKEEQEVFFNKLKNLGLNTNTIADVLDLQVEDLLKRRLPTIVAKKKLANTVKQARQMVVHKKVLIGGNVMSSPSYIVPVSDESEIKIKEKKKPIKPTEPEEKQEKPEPRSETGESSETQDTKENKEEGK